MKLEPLAKLSDEIRNCVPYIGVASKKHKDDTLWSVAGRIENVAVALEDEQARINAALASLEEEPLKEGDALVLGEHRGVIVRVTEDGKGAQLFWDNASHDWLPVFAVPFLIRGGATIERAG